MKTSVKAAVASVVAAVALAAGGYFGYTYFNENYVLLTSEEAFNIVMQFQMLGQQAFEAGRQACLKGAV